MTIKEMSERAHKNAMIKGFHDDFYDLVLQLSSPVGYKEGTVPAPVVFRQAYISQHLMLLVSEVGEAVEALRHKDGDNFKEELADIAIRLGDICGLCDIDLEAEIERKMKVNESRPRKHGKAF